jgi:hypothetical protein
MLIVDDRVPGAERVERDPQRADGALQDRDIRLIEGEARVLQQAPGFGRFRASLFRQVDVGPAGEAILPVPGALAVTQKNELVHVKNPAVRR